MARIRKKRPQKAKDESLFGLLTSAFRSESDGGGAPPWINLLWPGLAAVAVLGTMLASFTSIEPGQVAVRVNNLTGGHTVVTQPGWIYQMPFGVHSVYVLDASPQNFTMSGQDNLDDLHVRALTVRASDGSNFHFQDTTLIFQLKGDEAETVISDSGLDMAYLSWMRPYARAVLRDEFGRESTISVSNPAKFGEATQQAKERLNEYLGRHGLQVSQIVTPRPQFSDDYEKLVEQRNSLGNELKVIESNLAAAETTRERTLAEVNRDQNRSIQEKRTELESALAQATAEQSNTMRQVDTYKIETVGKGQAARAAAERKAEELKGQLDAEYRSRKAEIDAFRTQPVERVMERLGERLKGVTIDIQPWADDSTPSRVRMSQIAGAK